MKNKLIKSLFIVLYCCTFLTTTIAHSSAKFNFNKTATFCPEDTDNDGYCNDVDLDDDNDGILDEDEGCSTCTDGILINGNFELSNNFPLSSFIQTNENDVSGWQTTGSDNLIELWSSGFQGVTPQSGNYFAEINATHNAALFQKMCTQPGAVFSWSIYHRGRDGVDNAVVKIGASLSSASIVQTMSSGLSWTRYSGTYTVPAGQTETLFIFEATATASGDNSIGNFIDNVQVVGISEGTCLDTDNDGIPNSLDTDSDGDGCPDALEGGASLSSTAIDGNDRLIGGVNTMGVPIAAGNGQTIGTAYDSADFSSCINCDGINASISPTNILSCNTSQIQLNASNSTDVTTYQWTTTDGTILSGATTATPTITAAGTYILTVMNADDCIDTETIVVTQDNALPQAVIQAGQIFTCSLTSQQLDGGNSVDAVTYQWTTNDGNIVSGASTATPIVNSAGTYTLTITAANGCSDTKTIILTEDITSPTIHIQAPDLLTCDRTSTTLDATGTTNATTYEWTTNDGNILSGATTNTPTVGAPGTYTLLATAANGCTERSSILVNQDINPPTLVVASPATLTCVVPTINLNASSSTNITSYEWTTVDGIIIAGETTAAPSIQGAGTYTLVGIAANGCSATTSVTVNIDTLAPIVAIDAAAVLTCVQTSTTLDASGSTNRAGDIYQWATTDGNIVSGATTLMPTVNAAGTYTLQITSTNGCTNNRAITVTEDITPPVANAGNDLILTCTNTSFQLDASRSEGGVNFRWTTADGNITLGANTTMPTIDAVGTYSLFVTAANGCTDTDELIITEDIEAPIMRIAAPELLTCEVITIQLDASNSTNVVNYNWTTNDGNISNNPTTRTPTVNAAGTYTVTGTAANGCTATASIVVSQDVSLPTAIIDTPDQLTCDIRQLRLNGSNSRGGIRYLWTTIDGLILADATTAAPLIGDEGTYNLTVTTASGCTNVASVTVGTDKTTPLAAIMPAASLTCTTPTTTLDASNSTTQAGDTYQWTTTDGNIVSGATTLMPTINAAGTYTLTITSTNGCVDMEQLIVAEDALQPIADAGDAVELSCTTPSVQLDGSRSQFGTSYAWTTADGNITLGANTVRPTIDAAGTYTLTITAANGCTATDNVIVTTDDISPVVNIAAPQVLTCDLTRIQLDGTNSRNVVEYTWTTTNGNIISDFNTARPTIDAPGTYMLTGTAANGCQANASIIVTQDNTLPTIIIDPAPQLSCDLQQISLNGNNSTDVVSFLWTTVGGVIQSGANTPSAIISDNGTYTLTGTAANGCTNSANITITNDNSMPVAIIAPPATLTCAVLTTTLDASASTSGAGYIYQWTTIDGSITSGANTLLPIINAAGTYNLLITAPNGCIDTESIVVAEDITAPIAHAGTDEVVSCTTPSLQLDGSLSQNGTNFVWTTLDGNITLGTNTTSPTVDAAGIYTLLVTSANSCTATDTVVITADTVRPTLNILAPERLTCATPKIQLDATTSSNIATYQWTTTNGIIESGATTAMPTVTAAGTYTLTGIAANGCTATTSITVLEDRTNPTAIIDPAPQLSCDIRQIQLNGSNSLDAVSYLWTTVDGLIVDAANTPSVQIGDEGTYSLTVTAANGCTHTTETIITPDQTMPLATIATPEPLTCNRPSIILDASGSNTQIGDTYAWSTTNGNIIGGATTLQPKVSESGTYTLTVTGINGCIDMEQVVVTIDNNPPIAHAGNDQTLTCSQPSLQLDGSLSQNGISYEWTTVDGTIALGANTLSPTITDAGTYILTATAANGCTASDNVVIEKDTTLPNLHILLPETITCNQQRIQLDASTSVGVVTYLWSTTDGTIISSDDTAEPVVNTAGTYILKGTAANGCVAETSIRVDADIAAPTAIIDPAPQLSCALNEIRLNGSRSINAISYQWETIDGHIAADANTATPLITADGRYTLTVTGANDCIHTTEVTITNDHSLSTVNIAPPATLSCSNVSITLDASGSITRTGDTYEWTTMNGQLLSGVNTLNPEVNSPGVYTLSITSLNGCVDMGQILVIEDIAPPTAHAGSNQVLDCTVTSLQLDGTLSQPVVTYAWTTEDGNILSGANTATPTINQAGTYTLTITAANGCSATDVTTVRLANNPPLLTILNPATLTCSNQRVQLDASQSSNIVSYTWTTIDGIILNNENTATPVVGAAGTYTLTGTAANGCTAQSTVIVNEDVTLPTAIIDPAPQLSCSIMEIHLNGANSQNAISYEWTTTNGNIAAAANTATPLITDEGTYTLTVMGLNGCTHSSSINITNDATMPLATINSPTIITCANSTVTLNANGSSSNAIYEWTTNDGSILNGATTLTPEVGAAGTYILTVRTPNGCFATEQVIVQEDIAPPFANAGNDQVLNCVVTSLQLDASLSQNATAYAWSSIDGTILSGANTATPTITSVGTYTLTVTANNGCTATDDVNVTLDGVAPIIHILTPDALSCTQLDIQLDASTSTNMVSYAWTTSDGNITVGENTATPVVNASGNYTLVATATNGCTAETTIRVHNDLAKPTAIIDPAPFLNCDITTYRLNGSNSLNAVSYQWETVDGIITADANTAAALIANDGTYTLTVTGANGCIHSSSITVRNDATLPIANIAPAATLTCLVQEIILDGTNSTPNATYQWMTNDGNIVRDANTAQAVVNAAGTYFLMVTAANGCIDMGRIVVAEDITEPVANAGIDQDLTCVAPTLTLDGSFSQNVVNYAWTTSDGNIISGANTATPTINQAGTYTLTVTATNGCTHVDEMVVRLEQANPIPTIAQPEILTCLVRSTQLDATASIRATAYQWTTVDGNILNGASTAMPTVNTPGTYTLIVTAANGCTATLDVTVKEDKTGPIVTIDPAPMLTCDITSIRLNGANSQNAISYFWTTTDGHIISGATTAAPLVNQEGIYTLTVTGANGCSSSTRINVMNFHDRPVASIASPQTLTCLVQEITLDATASSPNAHYQWTTSDGNILSGATTLNPRVNTSGTYTLTVTATNGCTDFEEVYVQQTIQEPIANAGQDQVLTCSTPSLQLDGSFSQNVAAYTWTTDDGVITSGANTATPTVAATGVYTLVVTAVNGCTATDQVQITTDGASPMPIIAQPAIITCANPIVQLNANSSQDAVNYQWTTTNGHIISGNTTAQPVVDVAGTYVLTITAVNGCTTQTSVVVNEDKTPPTSIISPAQQLSCDRTAIRLDGSNSLNAVSYQWTTLDGYITQGANTAAPLILDEGLYTLTTTAANGCIHTSSITVTHDASIPMIEIAKPDTLTCATPQVTLNGITSAMDGQFIWSTNNGNILSGVRTLNPVVNAPGNYYLIVIGRNGCLAFEEIAVVENKNIPFAEAGPDQVLTCGQTNTTLNGSLSQNAVTYEWTTTNGNIVSGANTAIPTINAGGNYLLTITGANGCTSEDEVIVTQDELLPIITIAQPEILTCLKPRIQLSAISSTNVATYLWSTNDGHIIDGANTAIPTVDAAGTYTLVITAANGCKVETSILVNQDDDVPTVVIDPAPALTCDIPMIRLNGANSQGATTYLWTTLDGLIIADENTPTPLIADAGTYTLTVTNLNGCFSNRTITIIEDNTIPEPIISTPDTLTCNKGQITLNASTTTSNGRYLWTTTDGNIISGETTLNPIINAKGTYVLAITGENGCTGREEVVVYQDDNVPFADAGIDRLVTCKMETIQLDAGFSQNAIAYEWTTADGNIVSGANTATPFINQAGTYKLQVTGRNGCIANDQVDVRFDGVVPNIIMEQPPILTCLVDRIILDASASTNIATYAWSTPDGYIISENNTPSITVNKAGSYTLIATAANGCTATMAILVKEDVTTPTALIDPVAPLTCGVQEIRLNGSNSINAVNYQWFTFDGNIVADAQTAAPVINTIGTYSLIAIGENGCSDTTQIVVTDEVTSPMSVITPPDVLTCNQREVRLISNTSMVNPVYLWTTEDGNIIGQVNTPNVVVNAPGAYTLTVTGANGCRIFEQVFVTQDIQPPFVEAGSNQLISCSQNTLTLDAGLSQNVVDYQWTTEDGNIISGANTPNPIINQAGTYTLKGTAANGCKATDEVIITSNETKPVIQIAIPQVLSCTRTSIQLDANASIGVATFVWTTENGSIINGANTATPRVGQAGTYTLTATGANGCISKQSITVNEIIVSPVANIITPTTINCAHPQIWLNGGTSERAIAYEWFTVDGNIVEGGNTAGALVDAAGTYTLVVTASNGCTDAAEVVVEMDMTMTNPIIATPDTLTCASPQIILKGMDAASVTTYKWKTHDGNIISGANTQDIVVDKSGTYTLIVTGENGCTAFEEVYVTENFKAPFAEAGIDLLLNCNIDKVQLNGSLSQGVAEYSWTTIEGNFITRTDIATPVVNTADTYILVVKGANGCTATDTTIVRSDTAAPTIEIAVPELITCYQPRVKLDAKATTNAVAFEWTTTNGVIISDATTSTPTVGAAGQYKLTTTAATGCTASSFITVIDSALTSFEVIQATICEGEEIKVGSYYYETPGVYEHIFLGINRFGCDSLATLELEVLPNPIVNFENQTICAGDQVQITAPANGVKYEWSPSIGVSDPTIANPILQPLETTIYKLKVTDVNGCSGWGNIKITVIDVLADAGEDVHLCNPQPVQLNGRGIGAFSWSPAIGLNDATIANPVTMVTATTTYVLTTTTAEGCTASDSITVFVHEPPALIVDKIHPSCCNDDGEIRIRAADANRALTYRWVGDVSNNEVAKGLSAGVYTIIATDQYGCESITNIDLFQECFCSSIVEQEVFYEENGKICLPIKPDHVENFWFNVPVIHAWGCGYEKQVMYDPIQFPSYGQQGAYRVDYWVVNGDTLKGEVRNFEKLIAWMNYVDPDADWAHIQNINKVVGGHPDRTYGDLQLTQLSNSLKSTAVPKTLNVRHSIMLETDLKGADKLEVVIKNKRTCCYDKIIVKPNPASDSRFRSTLDLTAFADKNQTQLQWISNTGYKNQSFEIQRSQDGINFETLTQVENEEETSEMTVYTSSDELPLEGINYYRIKQIYKDGNFDFTSTQAVEFYQLPDFVIFPNPVENVLNINLKKYQGMEISIAIHNQFGQLLWQQAPKIIEKSVQQIDTQNFENGIYFIKIKGNHRRMLTKKLIVNRRY